MSDPQNKQKDLYVLSATIGAGPLWDRDGNEVSPDELSLSERLCVAIDDWRQFYDDVSGDLSDTDLADEFVSQGFKIAFRMRSELKGRLVSYRHPVDHHVIEIDPKTG